VEQQQQHQNEDGKKEGDNTINNKGGGPPEKSDDGDDAAAAAHDTNGGNTSTSMQNDGNVGGAQSDQKQSTSMQPQPPQNEKQQPYQPQPQQQQQQQQQRPDPTTLRALKPRNSDAVLSCPCCFTIVCMDCQRHVKYANQFRAMFVMNIGVRWDRRLKWDDNAGELIVIGSTAGGAARGGRSNEEQEEEENYHHGAERMTEYARQDARDVDRPVAIPTDESRQQQLLQLHGSTKVVSKEGGGEGEEAEMYYSVHCASCNTEVAYLNMDDEVYHFINCVASG
jgi:hypothetical protein